MTEESKDHGYWADVELFGHQRIVGYLSPSEFPAGMVQVRVPPTSKKKEWSKLYHVNAIYGVTQISEEAAIKLAEHLDQSPPAPWDFVQEEVEHLFVQEVVELLCFLYKQRHTPVQRLRNVAEEGQGVYDEERDY